MGREAWGVGSDYALLADRLGLHLAQLSLPASPMATPRQVVKTSPRQAWGVGRGSRGVGRGSEKYENLNRGNSKQGRQGRLFYGGFF